MADEGGRVNPSSVLQPGNAHSAHTNRVNCTVLPRQGAGTDLLSATAYGSNANSSTLLTTETALPSATDSQGKRESSLHHNLYLMAHEG